MRRAALAARPAAFAARRRTSYARAPPPARAPRKPRRSSSSFRAENSFSEPGLPDTPPTREQLQNHFMICAVPMVGFGLMDNTVMIHAGNAIDCTLGVAFGLSTLTAAACGQVCSDAAGVLFGGVLDRGAASLGLPRANLTLFQRRSAIAKRQSSVLKLRHDAGEALGFTVDVDNGARHDATTVTIEGPDIEGLVASLTAAIANSSYSLVTCAASPGDDADSVRDVFVIQTASGDQDPLNAHALKAENSALQHKQLALLERVAKLEAALEEASIKKQGKFLLRRRGDSGGLPP
ncbi:hypothetical protein JL720_13361 [Aureococcus anophagefferens]|nr:hypothetical protein JL720_13361 [Aureococcus anophagefferens]